MATLAPVTGEQSRTAGSPAQRAGASLMATLSWLAVRLPEWPLHRAAEVAGLIWYVTAPGRRAQARRNLRRVAEALAADGRGSPGVRAAARSSARLERLIMAAFGHLARYYLEVARGPAYRHVRLRGRIEDRSEGLFDRFLTEGWGMGAAPDGGSPGTGVILLGLHLGAIEFPSLLLAEAGIPITGPMETIANPPLQEYFLRTRGREGLRLIPQEGAHPHLLEALRRGEAVGLVSDRVTRGRGAPTPFLGHPARFPIGAPLLALETGAPVFAAAVWRVPGDRYAGRMVRLDVPTTGERPERIRQFLERQAEVFESFIAEAPEQWWSLFHPIWPDLEAASR